MDLNRALDYARPIKRGVLATVKADGRPQLSNIMFGVDPDGVVRISDFGIAGLALAFPIIGWQLYRFVAPGHDRRPGMESHEVAHRLRPAAVGVRLPTIATWGRDNASTQPIT